MDKLSPNWDEFIGQATEQLFSKFPGRWRALVVETNDPLNMRRVRFRIPEMHDSKLLPEDCPWAVPSPDLGGSRAGSFTHPCIGDTIWISFEKDHPYGPVWHGFATPTRRKKYTLAQIYTQSPIALKEDGSTDEAPEDYDKKYLPKDGRPMSVGRVDRYGNLELSSYVGFFPKEHADAPGKPGIDGVTEEAYKTPKDKPEINKPDLKYWARISKYGIGHIMGDQGYAWNNEFKGDTEKDDEFEIARYLYLQRLCNQDKTEGKDGRRNELFTRYGHRREMRDTGWNKSRKGEYGDKIVDLSTDTEHDLRWIKDRTKGGWSWFLYDKGFDPEEDEFVKRPLVEEIAGDVDKEIEAFGKKDGRMARLIGRHGFKFVLDERGTDPKSADKKETPRGNGWLLKGRRSGGRNTTGDPRGFHFESNENEDSNQSSWLSPLGQAVQINDDLEYIMVCNRLSDYTPKWQGLLENEFLRDSLAGRKALENTNHLLLDHQNSMIRLKSRTYRGDRSFVSKNDPDPQLRHQQGLEIHDGRKGDGPWVELVDGEERGVWMHKEQGITLLRGKTNSKLILCLDDKKGNVIISNKGNGKIQIDCDHAIEIISREDVTLQGRNVNIKASEELRFQSGTSTMQLATDLTLSGDLRANTIHAVLDGAMPGPGAGSSSASSNPIRAAQPLDLPKKISPADRGQIYNEPKQCSDAEIEHPV